MLPLILAIIALGGILYVGFLVGGGWGVVFALILSVALGEAMVASIARRQRGGETNG